MGTILKDTWLEAESQCFDSVSNATLSGGDKKPGTYLVVDSPATLTLHSNSGIGVSWPLSTSGLNAGVDISILSGTLSVEKTDLTMGIEGPLSLTLQRAGMLNISGPETTVIERQSKIVTYDTSKIYISAPAYLIGANITLKNASSLLLRKLQSLNSSVIEMNDDSRIELYTAGASRVYHDQFLINFQGGNPTLSIRSDVQGASPINLLDPALPKGLFNFSSKAKGALQIDVDAANGFKNTELFATGIISIDGTPQTSMSTFFETEYHNNEKRGDGTYSWITVKARTKP